MTKRSAELLEIAFKLLLMSYLVQWLFYYLKSVVVFVGK